jgi:hypothetical protein
MVHRFAGTAGTVVGVMCTAAKGKEDKAILVGGP